MKYYLYWVHRENHTDLKAQGYIGITKTPKIRFNRHRSESKLNPRWHIHYAINKYDDIKFDIICIGLKDYIVELENKLRPKGNIGWNTLVGGSQPTIGMPQSDESIQKRAEAQTIFSRDDYLAIFRDRYINDVVGSDIAKKFNCSTAIISLILARTRKFYKELDGEIDDIVANQKPTGRYKGVTEELYNQILDDRDSGLKLKFIAVKYGMLRETIGHICRSKYKYTKPFLERRMNKA